MYSYTLVDKLHQNFCNSCISACNHLYNSVSQFSYNFYTLQDKPYLPVCVHTHRKFFDTRENFLSPRRIGCSRCPSISDSYFARIRSGSDSLKIPRLFSSSLLRFSKTSLNSDFSNNEIGKQRVPESKSSLVLRFSWAISLAAA